MSKKERDAEEKRWRLEDDARTIRNFTELRDDKPRFRSAVQNIRKQARDLDKVAGSMSGRKKSRKTTRESGRR